MNRQHVGIFIFLILFFCFNLNIAIMAEYECSNEDFKQAVPVTNCGACEVGFNCIEIVPTNPSTPVSMDNPIGNNIDINVFIGNIINYVMGVIGSLFLLFFVYGGLIWMTSQGNSEKVSKAKNILIWNTLGIFVIFASYAIIKFILQAFQ
jgi:hypothetical protein